MRARATLAMLLAVAACAWPASAGDLFGGYSTARVDGAQTHGAAVAGSWRVGARARLAVEGTFQRGLVEGENFDEWAVLGGPLVTLRQDRRLTPFVHAKAGLVRSRRQVEVLGVAIGPDGVCDGGCPYSTGAAAEFGGGLDYRLDDRWSLRVPQVDYRVTWLDDDASANRLRISAGVVYRWRD